MKICTLTIYCVTQCTACSLYRLIKLNKSAFKYSKLSTSTQPFSTISLRHSFQKSWVSILHTMPFSSSVVIKFKAQKASQQYFVISLISSFAKKTFRFFSRIFCLVKLAPSILLRTKLSGSRIISSYCTETISGSILTGMQLEFSS